MHPEKNQARASHPPKGGNRLWFYRQQLGYSQKQVAALLGHKSSARVSNYERGTRLPGLAMALKLSLILQTPLAQLYPHLNAQLKREIEQNRLRVRGGRLQGRDIENKNLS